MYFFTSALKALVSSCAPTKEAVLTFIHIVVVSLINNYGASCPLRTRYYTSSAREITWHSRAQQMEITSQCGSVQSSVGYRYI